MLISITAFRIRDLWLSVSGFPSQRQHSEHIKQISRLLQVGSNVPVSLVTIIHCDVYYEYPPFSLAPAPAPAPPPSPRSIHVNVTGKNTVRISGFFFCRHNYNVFLIFFIKHFYLFFYLRLLHRQIFIKISSPVQKPSRFHHHFCVVFLLALQTDLIKKLNHLLIVRYYVEK